MFESNFLSNGAHWFERQDKVKYMNGFEAPPGTISMKIF